MKVIIFGATGTAGSEVVRQAMADRNVDKVTIVVRKALDFTHPKVKMIVHQDFLEYGSLLSEFREADACIWCLGISQNKVTKDQYHTITYDYVIAAAKAMLSVNPEIKFVFLSGQGADSSERSRILFARVKGKAENALKLLPFKWLYILRPAGIVPVFLPENLTSAKKREFKLVKLVAKILPGYAISTLQLSQAMLKLVKNESPSVLLENKEIKAIADAK
ncbi:MAG: NAD(P)H-binding protein [Prolixibacteraceae bacterium]